MNGYRSRLRGRDGVVVLGCVLLALLTLGAIGEGGRRRAKEIVCQSNLRQWHNIFQGYLEENDGKFLSGCNDQGYWWPLQLPHELQDWKRNRTWFCPTATTPMWDETGVRTPSLDITNAWGIHKPSTTGAPATMTYQGSNADFRDLNRAVVLRQLRVFCEEVLGLSRIDRPSADQ